MADRRFGSGFGGDPTSEPGLVLEDDDVVYIVKPDGTRIPAGGGGSGNTTAQVVASGKVLPVADATGVTVDTTTYSNPVEGADKLTVLMFPLDTALVAWAIAGDAHPRAILACDTADGWYFGDGTYDPYVSGNAVLAVDVSGNTVISPAKSNQIVNLAGRAQANAAALQGQLPQLQQLSPLFSIVNGALPTVQLVTATGAQIQTGTDSETVTPVTFNSGAANTATCLVQLSPDNVTYSTLGTESEPVGVALAGTIHLVKVRVPAGWYIKLTVNAQATLGLTTYY
jgi:hypothetical protein